MPKRKDLKKILVVGAGPIVIGQACEFDYSGVQACKSLKEEGYKIILINFLLEILEECKRFNNWKEYNASNAFNAGLAEGTAGRWIGKPTHETFPTFMKWYEERTRNLHICVGNSVFWKLLR